MASCTPPQMATSPSQSPDVPLTPCAGTLAIGATACCRASSPSLSSGLLPSEEDDSDDGSEPSKDSLESPLPRPPLVRREVQDPSPRREARAAAAEAAGRPRQGEPPRVSVEAAILRVECVESEGKAQNGSLKAQTPRSATAEVRRAATRGVACGRAERCVSRTCSRCRHQADR